MSNILIACDSDRNVVRLIKESITKNNTVLSDEELANWVLDTYIRRTKNHMFLVNTCARYLKPFFDNKFGKNSGVFEKFIAQCQQHDLDKFHGNEKVACYAVRSIMYNPKWKVLYETSEKAKEDFLNIHWPDHYKKNQHHPENWGKIIKEDEASDVNSYTRCTRDNFEAKFKTPEEQAIVIAEMVADWMAMGVELGDSANHWDRISNGKRFVWDDDIRDMYLDPLLILEPKKIVVEVPYPENTFPIPELKNSSSEVQEYKYEDFEIPSCEGLFDPVKIVDNIFYEIRNFPVDAFFRRLHKAYKTSKLEHLIQVVGIAWWASNKRSIKIHRFFIPELIFLLEKFKFPKSLIETIKSNTWISDRSNMNTKIDISRIAKNMNCKLYPHQMDFINSYPINKDTRKLRGYLLSFEQGLGKTITSLALMEALGKDKVVIICPKNTMIETWQKHIETFYNNPQGVHFAGFRNTPGEKRFFIFNYDRIGELDDKFYQDQFKRKSVGIIIDESHNFLRQQSLRTQGLIHLAKSGIASDVLLLSGTPLKCQGVEMMPLMKTLDPFFDEIAEDIFKRSFGVNTEIAADVLNSRLHMMMTRVTKEILDLPEKREWIINIQMPTGYKYTMKSVKLAIADYIADRKEFHKKQMDTYIKEFNECIDYLKSKLGRDRDFLEYLDIIERLIKNNGQYVWGDTTITWANKYEKEVLEPMLPSDLLKKFRHSKAAVKYLHLKIRGEVLGNCLMHLRMQMTSEMLMAGDIQKLVAEAIKKTVIFTSYVDTIETCEKYFKSKNYDPLSIYGKTSDNLAALVNEFQTNADKNPLIASIQTLSTGATLTAANRLIFLNKPWRSIEYQQASDRIHRIGQDTPVDIISLVLDTGKEGNLSTRMEEVMAWSNSLFSAIVDGETSTEQITYPEDAEYGYGEEAITVKTEKDDRGKISKSHKDMCGKYLYHGTHRDLDIQSLGIHICKNRANTDIKVPCVYMTRSIGLACLHCVPFMIGHGSKLQNYKEHFVNLEEAINSNNKIDNVEIVHNDKSLEECSGERDGYIYCVKKEDCIDDLYYATPKKPNNWNFVAYKQLPIDKKIKVHVKWHKKYDEAFAKKVASGYQAVENFGPDFFEFDNVEASMEAVTSVVNKKRQDVTNYICDIYDKIDPSKTNSKIFRGVVDKMSDKEFDQFMNYIKEGKYQLHIIAPNLKINLKNEDILKAADAVGCQLFHRFWVDDPSTGRKFLTDNEYLVIQVPIRRQQQFLDEKIAVPDHDRTIDGMTGQVTGDSRNCSVTNPEIQILAARGLNNTLQEFINVRGGNINNYNDFRRALEETGECNLGDLDPNSKTRVAVVGGVLLKSMMLDTNL